MYICRSRAVFRRRFRTLSLAVGAMCWVWQDSRADTVWQAGTGDWFTAGNWSAGVPSAAVTADINNGGTAQIASGTADPFEFNLGQAVGQSGSINLTNGTITNNAAGIEYVGYSGSGTITQSGGTNDIGSGAFLDLGYNSGSTGTYLLSGTGTLNGVQKIGLSGVGLFTQSGGLNNASTLDLNPTGTYNLQGGTIAAQVINLNGGTISQTGGAISFAIANESAGQLSLNAISLGSGGFGGIINLSGGICTTSAISVNSGASFAQTGGTVSSPTISVSSGGTFSQTSGDLVVPTINVGPGGTFSQSGGTNSIATVNQSGGGVTWSSIMLFGQDIPLYECAAIPIYNYSSGTFTAVNEYVGYGTTGSYSQSIGSNVAGSLSLGNGVNGTGTYTLSGTGTLSATEYVGVNGSGALNQSGGGNASTNGTLFLAARGFNLVPATQQ